MNTLTLVPAGEYADKSVKSMDDRRVYEIYPGNKLEAIQDFEGRSVQPGAEAGSAPARPGWGIDGGGGPACPNICS